MSKSYSEGTEANKGVLCFSPARPNIDDFTCYIGANTVNAYQH